MASGSCQSDVDAGEEVLGGNRGEPFKAGTLLEGEAAVADGVIWEGRWGRENIRFAEGGVSWMPWAHASAQWGAHVWGLVSGSERSLSAVRGYYPDAQTMVPEASRRFSEGRMWKGVTAFTWGTPRDWDIIVRTLVNLWPGVSIIVAPGDVGKRVLERALTKEVRAARVYLGRVRHRKIRHSEVGGVTRSLWSVWCLSHKDLPSAVKLDLNWGLVPYQRWVGADLNPVTKYRRMEIEIKAGDPGDEAEQGVIIEGVVRRATSQRYGATQEVAGGVIYSDRGLLGERALAAHLSSMAPPVWVQTDTVFKKERIVRPISAEERALIWDYPNLVPPKGRSGSALAQHGMRDCLSGPPGKVVRTILFHVFEQVLPLWGKGEKGETVGAPEVLRVVGVNTGEFTALKILGGLEGEVDERYLTVARADDAEVELEVWKIPGETGEEIEARQGMRIFFHQVWRRRITREATGWLRANGNRKRDKEVIWDAITRNALSEWFDWSDGSTLHFWRWPREWREEIRDGTMLWHEEAPIPWFGQNTKAEPDMERWLRAKEDILINRRYLEDSKFVELLVSRFGVPKVVDDAGNLLDIRCVWDSKKNGHNKTLWAPGFMNQSFSHLLELLVPGRWLVDRDLGENFLNNTLHYKERSQFGVRVIRANAEGIEEEKFVRFTRLFFGCTASPYLAGQQCARLVELMRGDRKAENNAFQWDRVLLNLPGTAEHNPALPRCMKIRKDGTLAGELARMVDDLRGVGNDEIHARQVGRTMGATANYYGNQDAARKARPPSQCGGPWNGGIVHTSHGLLRKSTTQKKWTKFGKQIRGFLGEIRAGRKVNYRELRSSAGLGINVTEVYSDYRCFVSLFFRTMQGWRPDRDEHGFHIRDAAQLLDIAEALGVDPEDLPGGDDHPEMVEALPELLPALEALEEFLGVDEPRVVRVRPTHETSCAYGYGDAAGSGFSAGLRRRTGRVSCRHGIWCKEQSEYGSNWREFRNLANMLLKELAEGTLCDHLIWVFTDNVTASMCWNKGRSKAKQLFDICLKLKIAAREAGAFIKFAHISGLRMIRTGYDGGSRGDYDTGGFAGENHLEFVPLHKTALEWGGETIQQHLRECLGKVDLAPLTPEGWFTTGHRGPEHLWAPPPAAALIALEQISEARHKRPYATKHMVVIPRLLYYEEWRRRFEKEVDFWVMIPTGDYWPHSCFEPLLLGLSFPMRRESPWLLRRHAGLVGFQRKMHEMFRDADVGVWNILREF